MQPKAQALQSANPADVEESMSRTQATVNDGHVGNLNYSGPTQGSDFLDGLQTTFNEFDRSVAELDAYTSSPQVHTVQSGESLSTILGTSDPAAIGAFMRANNLTSSTIRPGDQLVLPNGGYSHGDAALGQAVLNSDNARLAALHAPLVSAGDGVPLYLNQSSLPSVLQWPANPVDQLEYQINSGSLQRDVVPDAPAPITAEMRAFDPSAQTLRQLRSATLDAVLSNPFAAIAYDGAVLAGTDDVTASKFAFAGGAVGDMFMAGAGGRALPGAGVGAAAEEQTVYFGQRRVSPIFSKEGPPSYLAGRPILDVAEDLRSGRRLSIRFAWLANVPVP